MSADATERACREHSAVPLRTVDSNRITVLCTAQGGELPKVMAVHCSEAGGAPRLCIVTQSNNLSTAQAAIALHRDLSSKLTSRFGPVSEQQPGVLTWRGADATVDLTVSDDKVEVTLLHATPAGIALLTKPAPEFPTHVAGLPFGATAEAGRSHCTSNGGTVLDLRALNAKPIAPAIACGGLRAELPLAVASTVALLCEGRVCEIALILTDAPSVALETLVAKYGPPITTTESGSCKPNALRHAWVWGALGKKQAMLRLIDDCGLSLFYDDQEGVRLRDAELSRKQQNF